MVIGYDLLHLLSILVVKGMLIVCYKANNQVCQIVLNGCVNIKRVYLSIKIASYIRIP